MTVLTFHPTQTQSDCVHSFFAYDPYIETFWLPAIGPTATWLINDLSIRALLATQTFSIDASELSVRMGTGIRDGHCSPVVKQLNRLCQAGIFHEIDTHEYLVPRTIDPLPNYVARKLTDEQRNHHEQWMNRLSISPVSTQRRRVRSLVARLETMGVASSLIARTLFATGLHPSIIGEAISATTRQNSAA